MASGRRQDQEWVQWVRAASLSVAASLAFGSAALAQSASGTLPVSARVRQPIVITPQRNLDFGGVIPGTSKTIAVSDATSGRFRVRGENGAAVLLSFTLPGDLVSGANLLPIGTWTGYWNQSASTTGGTTFTPSASQTGATLGNGAGQVFVYIGGQVTPATNQPGGTYTATVTLIVDYP